MRGRRATAGLVLAVCALGAPATAAAQLLPPLLGGPKGSPGDGAPRYANPVLPGDYPDPSVIHDGGDYWGVVTSGGWRPPFAVLHSSDLVNWQVAGSVLARRPRWARGQFWAPELEKRGNRYLVYYAARSMSGPFCVAVASARSPLAFFDDHGPIVCPKLGAIDPVAVRDEGGRPYLLWKVDGNPRRRPAQIVAAPLSASGLRLKGKPRVLIRNDLPWERRVVEAPTLASHEGKLYLLYSGGRCCGPSCDYAVGAARSAHLLGPWEKRPDPIVQRNPRFRCPGHGAVVDGPKGDQYLLYHAYGARGSDVGRALLLDKLDWAPDGWPRVNGDGGPSAAAPSPEGAAQLRGPPRFTDEFTGGFLTAGWQWPEQPVRRVDARSGGRLWLGKVRGKQPAAGVVGRQPNASWFAAETVVGARRAGATAGLAVYADAAHAIGIEIRGGRVAVWRAGGGKPVTLASLPIGRPRLVPLRIRAAGDGGFGFDVSPGGGWTAVGAPSYAAPRWGGETHVVLRVDGPLRARAAFERFTIGPQ